MSLSGTGIPANAFVTAKADATHFTMSEANTSNNGSSKTINFDDGRMADTFGEVSKFPEVQSNDENTDGTLTMFHTGQGNASTRVNHWDGYYQCTPATMDTGVCDFVPFVHKMASTDAASAPVSLSRLGSTFTNDDGDIYGNGPDTNAFVKLSNSDQTNDTVADMAMGKWYYLDAYLNISNDYITWVVSDTSDKVLGSVQQKHSGGSSGTINHKTSMFPYWLSIWVTNIQVGKLKKGYTAGLRGELAGTGGSYFSVAQDSEVDILIDNITISNYEPKVNNNTVTKGRLTIPSMTIEGSAEDAIPLLNTSITVGEKLSSIMGRDGDQRACTPTYISWGAEDNIWKDNTSHIFMGGYTSNNSIYEDATDSDKRIRFGKTSTDDNSQIRFFTFLNHANNILGSGIVDYASTRMDYGPNFNAGSTPSLSYVDVGRSASNAGTPSMMVDSFTKKGFITIRAPKYAEDGAADGDDTGTWVKTANPMFSTKIMGWDEDNPNIISVGSIDTLAAYREDEFIIYRNGYAYNTTLASNTYLRSGLKIKNISSVGKVTLEPASGARSAKFANDGTTLFHHSILHELYISPRKYWVVAEIYNETTSGFLLPTKKYTHSVVCDNTLNPEAVSSTKGVTFNERKYSDTTIPSDSWFHLNSDDKTSLIETRVDYGFGAYTDGDAKATDGENGLGYIQKFIPKEGENIVDLGGMVEVEKGRLNQTDEIITLILKSSLDNKGGSALISTKFPDANKHPALTYIFKDEIPTVTNFKVQPSEVDPFLPEFNWETEDDDLWYGFLILDTENIAHQYHKAVMHIPMNEKPSGQLYAPDVDNFGLGAESHVYTYVAGGTDFNGDTMEIGDSDRAVGSSSIANTNNLLDAVDIEGLAGNCLHFNGSDVDTGNRRISFAAYNYPDPQDALSIIGHFTVDRLLGTNSIDSEEDDKGYILFAENCYSVWVDKNGKVNASVTTNDQEVTCTLISAYTVPVGRDIPTNFILVVDTTLLTGNCKLYINGRLEDQTGFKTTDGGANNWKIGEIIEPLASNLNIGFEGFTGKNFFNGKIEELTIYKIPIYPVIPKDGKVTLNKSMQEFTEGFVAAGRPINAKLFIKDYHNIRGTIKEEVASTSQIAIKKSGLGLKTSL